MTTKHFKKTDKKGREETWEWEETPEVVAALKKLHAVETVSYTHLTLPTNREV